jgi:hypothetical protein
MITTCANSFDVKVVGNLPREYIYGQLLWQRVLKECDLFSVR